MLFLARNRASGLTLLEVLIVVGILAFVGGVVIVGFDDAEQLAGEQLGRAEISEIKSALLRFRRDTGFLPGQGPFRRVADGGAVPDAHLPPDVQALTAAEIANWFASPANFWQLHDNPLDDDNPAVEHHPLESWDPVRKRGWNGPYLPRFGNGLLTIGVVAADGSEDPFNPPGAETIGLVQGIADPYFAPNIGLPQWAPFDAVAAVPSRQGRPYFAFDLDDPSSARLVGVGPDGSYVDAADNVSVFLLR